MQSQALELDGGHREKRVRVVLCSVAFSSFGHVLAQGSVSL
jgi:hypothetical protein